MTNGAMYRVVTSTSAYAVSAVGAGTATTQPRCQARRRAFLGRPLPGARRTEEHDERSERRHILERGNLPKIPWRRGPTCQLIGRPPHYHRAGSYQTPGFGALARAARRRRPAGGNPQQVSTRSPATLCWMAIHRSSSPRHRPCARSRQMSVGLRAATARRTTARRSQPTSAMRANRGAPARRPPRRRERAWRDRRATTARGSTIPRERAESQRDAEHDRRAAGCPGRSPPASGAARRTRGTPRC